MAGKYPHILNWTLSMFAFGPDGAQIAYTTAGEGVDIYDIESGQRRATNIAPDWLAVANTFGVQWVITAPNFSELSPPESNRMLELSVGPDGVRVFNTETKTAIAQMAHQAESMRFISSSVPASSTMTC